jgi:hypothetical protein
VQGSSPGNFQAVAVNLSAAERGLKNQLHHCLLSSVSCGDFPQEAIELNLTLVWIGQIRRTHPAAKAATKK